MINKKTLSLLCALLILLIPIKSFALNLDYLDNNTWNNNPNVTSISISGKSGANKMQGVFRYCYDNECAGFYTYFNVSESTLNDSNNIVKIHYDIYNDSCFYSFSIDQDGLVDFGDEEYKYFGAFSCFEMLSDNSVCCMSATEINCKPDTYTVDIKLHINGRNYNIIKGYTINTEKPTTTKETTTKQVTTKNLTTTKTPKDTTSSSKKSSSSSSTKYKSSGKYDLASNEYVVDENSFEAQINDSTISSTQSKKIMSKSSKILLIVGIIIAVIAILFIAFSIFKPKKQTTDENDEKHDNIQE